MSKSGQVTSVMRDPLLDRARDASRPILLIGFLHQENLGLGYLSAMLRRYGYKVVVMDFEADAEDILRVARACNPLVVGEPEIAGSQGLDRLEPGRLERGLADPDGGHEALPDRDQARHGQRDLAPERRLRRPRHHAAEFHAQAGPNQVTDADWSCPVPGPRLRCRYGGDVRGGHRARPFESNPRRSITGGSGTGMAPMSIAASAS